MKSKLVFILGTAVLNCVLLAPTSLRAQSPIVATMDESVAAFRKIVVLMDGSSALDAGNRQRVRTAAWILFE